MHPRGMTELALLFFALLCFGSIGMTVFHNMCHIKNLVHDGSDFRLPPSVRQPQRSQRRLDLTYVHSTTLVLHRSEKHLTLHWH